MARRRKRKKRKPNPKMKVRLKRKKRKKGKKGKKEQTDLYKRKVRTKIVEKRKPKKFEQPTLLSNDANLSIDGYEFIAEECNVKNGISHRKIIKTKIFNGGEVGTMGEYIPTECDVTTHLRVPEGKPHYYDNMFNYLMTKPVKVISPLLGASFEAYCEFDREIVEGTNNLIELSINIYEATSARLKIDNELYSNKRLTIYDVENW